MQTDTWHMTPNTLRERAREGRERFVGEGAGAFLPLLLSVLGMQFISLKQVIFYLKIPLDSFPLLFFFAFLLANTFQVSLSRHLRMHKLRVVAIKIEIFSRDNTNNKATRLLFPNHRKLGLRGMSLEGEIETPNCGKVNEEESGCNKNISPLLLLNLMMMRRNNDLLDDDLESSEVHVDVHSHK